MRGWVGAIVKLISAPSSQVWGAGRKGLIKMKKRILGRKFSRGQGARRALFRSLIRALVSNGSIETTKAKAKTIQREVGRVVNMAKTGGVSAQRRVYAKLGNDKKTTKGLFEKVVPVFDGRTGGYTRIINLPRRRGDAAEMARLEWVEEIQSDTPKTRARIRQASRASSTGSISSKKIEKRVKADKKGKAQSVLKKLKTLGKKK